MQYQKNTDELNSFEFKNFEKIKFLIHTNPLRASYFVHEGEKHQFSLPPAILQSLMHSGGNFELKIYKNSTYAENAILQKSEKMNSLKKNLEMFNIDLNNLFFIEFKRLDKASLLTDITEIKIPLIASDTAKIQQSSQCACMTTAGLEILSKKLNSSNLQIETQFKKSFWIQFISLFLPKSKITNMEVHIVDSKIINLLSNINQVYSKEEKFLIENPDKQMKHAPKPSGPDLITDVMSVFKGFKELGNKIANQYLNSSFLKKTSFMNQSSINSLYKSDMKVYDLNKIFDQHTEKLYSSKNHLEKYEEEVYSQNHLDEYEEESYSSKNHLEEIKINQFIDLNKKMLEKLNHKNSINTTTTIITSSKKKKIKQL